MHEIHFRLRNINKDDWLRLKNLARELTGTDSPTRLARTLINQALKKCKQEKNLHGSDSVDDNKSTRLEIRLPGDIMQLLKEQAQINGMNINQYVRLLVVAHIDNKPISTSNEIQALREANLALVKIGTNINTIAKALNSGHQASLTTQELQMLRTMIENQIGKTGELIQASMSRLS